MESEQRLFRYLGTFVGGFTLSAAEAVCNANGNINIESDDLPALQVLIGVKSLADRNLLRRLQPQVEEDSRLTMLETVREYANEQLSASGEVEIIRKMHAAYFLSLAEMAKPGPMNQEGLVWLDKLKPEQDNFRAAQSWFMEGKENSADVQLLRMLQALQHYWERRTQPSEFLGWLERGLAQAVVDNPLRIWARKRGSIQAINMGDFALAQEWVEHALKIAVEANDRWQVTESRSLLAGVMASRNDYVAAVTLWEQSLVVYREMGKDFQIGSILSNLAAAAIFRGDYKSAESMCRESLGIFRELGNKPGIVWSCINLGDALRCLGKLEDAGSALLEALLLAQEVESAMMAAHALVGLGALSLETSKSIKSGMSRKLEKAARICGLATGLLDRSGTSLETRSHMEFEGTEAALRAQLTKGAFAAAWEQGYKGNIDQAWEIATQEPEVEKSGAQSGRIDHTKKAAMGGLTTREFEVASLVAQGLTNADVARQLILSERTIEMHISNALHKLGFARRSELTSWIINISLPDAD
ncbi:MAG: tetratricopeptide repeat protein [Chloroflexia bacterium]